MTYTQKKALFNQTARPYNKKSILKTKLDEFRDVRHIRNPTYYGTLYDNLWPHYPTVRRRLHHDNNDTEVLVRIPDEDISSSSSQRPSLENSETSSSYDSFSSPSSSSLTEFWYIDRQRNLDYPQMKSENVQENSEIPSDSSPKITESPDKDSKSTQTPSESSQTHIDSSEKVSESLQISSESSPDPQGSSEKIRDSSQISNESSQGLKGSSEGSGGSLQKASESPQTLDDSQGPGGGQTIVVTNNELKGNEESSDKATSNMSCRESLTTPEKLLSNTHEHVRLPQDENSCGDITRQFLLKKGNTDITLTVNMSKCKNRHNAEYFDKFKCQTLKPRDKESCNNSAALARLTLENTVEKDLGCNEKEVIYTFRLSKGCQAVKFAECDPDLKKPRNVRRRRGPRVQRREGSIETPTTSKEKRYRNNPWSSSHQRKTDGVVKHPENTIDGMSCDQHELVAGVVVNQHQPKQGLKAHPEPVSDKSEKPATNSFSNSSRGIERLAKYDNAISRGQNIDADKMGFGDETCLDHHESEMPATCSSLRCFPNDDCCDSVLDNTRNPYASHNSVIVCESNLLTFIILGLLFLNFAIISTLIW